MVVPMSKLLIQNLSGQKTKVPSMWIMRQAGRYLPEYHETRAHAPNFLDACLRPEIATEITLQPIRRFGFDGAVIFSDILVIPYALGQSVVFNPKPVLGPWQFPNYDESDYLEKLQPVYEALRLTKSKLSPNTSLIGFAATPWTLGTYMLGKDIHSPDLPRLIDLLVPAIITHLRHQILAGAEAIQLFDSWSAQCQNLSYLVEPVRQIATTLKEEFPHVPFIYYSREVPDVLTQLIDLPICLGVDHTISLEWIEKNIPANIPIQGNLQAEKLIAGDFKQDVDRILDFAQKRPWVFNLGHGILPETPLDHVYQLVQQVRQHD